MTLTIEDGAIEVEAEAITGRGEQTDEPLGLRPEECLDTALGEAPKEPQDGVIAREARDAEQGMESGVKAKPIAVSKARCAEDNGDEEGAEGVGQGDGVR